MALRRGDNKSVLVAMSGGVDSSVAAGLLQRAGYEVTGVFMCLGQAAKESGGHPGCCSPEDAADARAVAARLGIGFHVLNFQRDLEEIIRYFVDEYRVGRTPNPCVACNTRLKFGKLLQFAEAMGIDYVATGHYARVLEAGGGYRLYWGVDPTKDQSYALFGMGGSKLAKVLLPVGEYRKGEIRALAAEWRLPVHDKRESQEICFVPDDDYAGLVARRAPELCRIGPIVDTSGKVLGEHQGVYRYTIGQRRGLGVALGYPAYVVRLDAATNTVVLGSREELCQRRLVGREMVWMGPRPEVSRFAAMVQIRYNHRGTAGRVTVRKMGDDDYDTIEVDFEQPVSAITPGQAVVLYDPQNEYIIGGGWIERGE